MNVLKTLLSSLLKEHQSFIPKKLGCIFHSAQVQVQKVVYSRSEKVEVGQTSSDENHFGRRQPPILVNRGEPVFLGLGL